ncbi:hypothetical protein K523DRAFT_412114 [Schizophyllum commune Tattone D]|nr:hypothetical protein K523DRAFT_412114 [Schizophyllum commune Tattone D]
MASQSLPTDQLTIHVMLPGADTFTLLHPIAYSLYVGGGVDSTSFAPIPPEKRFLCAAKTRVHGNEISPDRLSTGCYNSTQSALVLSVAAVPSDYAPALKGDNLFSEADPPIRREDPHPCFAIKLANHVHDSGPYGQGDLWYEILERETLFYQRRLRQLQGVAVPTHYGMWTGTAPWGATIACSIMQWCGEQYMEDANDRRLYSIERSLKVVNAVRALHLIGYLHGDFLVEDWEQHRLYHHFLYDEEREKAFIIDFRRRARHDCELAFELREYKTYVPGYLFGCGELYTMAVALGLIRRRDSEDQIEDKAVIDAMRRFQEDDDYPKSGYLSEYSDTDSDPYASD